MLLLQLAFSFIIPTIPFFEWFTKLFEDWKMVSSMFCLLIAESLQAVTILLLQKQRSPLKIYLYFISLFIISNY